MLTWWTFPDLLPVFQRISHLMLYWNSVGAQINLLTQENVAFTFSLIHRIKRHSFRSFLLPNISFFLKPSTWSLPFFIFIHFFLPFDFSEETYFFLFFFSLRQKNSSFELKNLPLPREWIPEINNSLVT